VKYIKNYYDFILTESSYNSDGISYSLVSKTQNHIQKNLIQLLRINKKHINFIGGAGKGLSEDTTKNINVCVNKNEIIKENNLSEDEIFEFVEKQIKRINLDLEVKKDENRIIAYWPVEGIIKKGIVETSIEFSDIDWVGFSRFSPDLNEGENKFSGKYRHALLKAIVESLKQEVLSYFDDKDTVKEFREYNYDVHNGLYYITKSFEAKNGILNKSRIIENSKKIVTNKPEEFIKIIFGNEAETNKFMTFEKCWEEFISNDFLKKKRKKIFEKFKKNLINLNLQIPENLKI
jgi:hypothetical protein